MRLLQYDKEWLRKHIDKYGRPKTLYGSFYLRINRIGWATLHLLVVALFGLLLWLLIDPAGVASALRSIADAVAEGAV